MILSCALFVYTTFFYITHIHIYKKNKQWLYILVVLNVFILWGNNVAQKFEIWENMGNYRKNKIASTDKKKYILVYKKTSILYTMN